MKNNKSVKYLKNKTTIISKENRVKSKKNQIKHKRYQPFICRPFNQFSSYCILYLAKYGVRSD